MVTESKQPAKPRASAFTKHETFHLRHSWIAKGIMSIKSGEVNFDDLDAHHELGIGINMLRSLAYWMQATQLAEFTGVPKGDGPPFRLTDLGEIIAEFDPYLEDMGTWWLIQYSLASNRKLAPLWYWVFNSMRARDFTEETLFQGYTRFVREDLGGEIADETARRDIKCFRRTYAPPTNPTRGTQEEDLLDCPIADLNLIKESPTPGLYSLKSGSQQSLPSLIFGYSVLRFKESDANERPTVSTDDLRWTPLSPGRIFCLDSSNTIDLIERLDRDHDFIQLSRSEGISQAFISPNVSSQTILRRYYRGG